MPNKQPDLPETRRLLRRLYAYLSEHPKEGPFDAILFAALHDAAAEELGLEKNQRLLTRRDLQLP